MGTISWLPVFAFTPCLFLVVSQRCWPCVQGTANVTSSHRDMGPYRDSFQGNRAGTDSQGPPLCPSKEQSSWASRGLAHPVPGIRHLHGGGNGPGTGWVVGPQMSHAGQACRELQTSPAMLLLDKGWWPWEADIESWLVERMQKPQERSGRRSQDCQGPESSFVIFTDSQRLQNSLLYGLWLHRNCTSSKGWEIAEQLTNKEEKYVHQEQMGVHKIKSLM